MKPLSGREQVELGIRAAQLAKTALTLLNVQDTTTAQLIMDQAAGEVIEITEILRRIEGGR